MESGLTSVGKRLIALGLSQLLVAIYIPAALSYPKRFTNAKRVAVTSFLHCKQLEDDCPEDYDEYPLDSFMVGLSLVLSFHSICSSLFLIGTPAQIKLWKYWLAGLLLFCHMPDPGGRYKAWSEDSELQRFRRSERSVRRAQVIQRAEEARREMTSGQQMEMRSKTSALNENLVRDEASPDDVIASSGLTVTTT